MYYTSHIMQGQELKTHKIGDVLQQVMGKIHKNIMEICEYTHMQLDVCIVLECIICIHAVDK